MELRNRAEQDIEAFFETLRSSEEPFFNERDFQVELAYYLRTTGHYTAVYLEYTLGRAVFDGVPHDCYPCSDLNKYPWQNEATVRVDIVLELEGDFYAIELKYKIAHDKICLTRFGEQLYDAVLRGQGAQNYGAYEFWKDVKRLELLRRRFPRVVGAMAIFLSNDNSYQSPTRRGSMSEPFSMAGEATASQHKYWAVEGRTHSIDIEKYPNIQLWASYPLEWHHIGSMGCRYTSFSYCTASILSVPTLDIPIVDSMQGVELVVNGELEMDNTTQTLVYAKAQNRCALAVLHAYMLRYPGTTLEMLRAVFPKAIAPDSGVENNLELRELALAPGWRGHFIADDECLTMAGGEEVVLNCMWTANSLRRLLAVAKEQGIVLVDKPEAIPNVYVEKAKFIIGSELPM